MRVVVWPGVQLEEWFRWFAHPFGGGVGRGYAQYPAFAPSSSEVEGGFFILFFGLFVSCCPEFAPTGQCMWLILLPYSFLYFVAQGDICPGPRSQPVSTGC